jgi:rRNA-processing protein FCF1
VSALLKTKSDEAAEINSSVSCLIDTNGFMIPVQFGVDIFSELNRLGFSRFLTASAVLFELTRLSQTVSGSDKAAVRIALQLAQKCQIIDADSDADKDLQSKTGKEPQTKNTYADDVLFNYAVENSIAVLTNDVQLRQKLTQKGIPVISMRQTKRLDFVSQK